MPLTTSLDTLLEFPEVAKAYHLIQNEQSLCFEELWSAPKAALLCLAQKATGKHILLLSEEDSSSFKLLYDLESFGANVIDFPSWETLPKEGIAPSSDIVGERYKTLQAILEAKSPLIVRTSLKSVLQKILLPESFSSYFTTFSLRQQIDLEAVAKQLTEMGYERLATCSDKGEFAIRGGILDLFPVDATEPVRIELFGDEIESMRTYDPVGQKSVRKIEKIEVFAAKELEIIQKEANLCFILDYLKENVIISFDNILELEDQYSKMVSSFGAPTRLFASFQELFSHVKNRQFLLFAEKPLVELSEVESSKKTGEVCFEMFSESFKVFRTPLFFEDTASILTPDSELPPSLQDALLGLKNLKKDAQIILTTLYESDKAFIQEKLQELGVLLPKTTLWEHSSLTSGFSFPEKNWFLFSYQELAGKVQLRRKKLRSTFHTTPSLFHDLAPGDLVVHYHNGIGKYLGQEKQRDHEGKEREFMLIEYADSARLFVPMHQAHLVTKYIGSHDEKPSFHTIGGKVWQKTKLKTEKAIVGYAKELIESHAKREIIGGFAFSFDSPDLQAFEEEFPFEETEDQLDAIASVKEDMISPKAMDRLICGDVGYGKTEVAMRSAFKAVVDGGKQVAMLVPTTVLAMQHYENFAERMGNYPVRVEVISRFRKTKDVQKALEDVQAGKVDILIGTHRIISEDVHFKNLGLVIIDEEQRFGVKAKEHLKRVKSGVDCLTLSATPIPRTLYLSLIGARDMSVINSPPFDRLPIKTVIVEPQDELIKTAIEREIARNGQVYFIHNRVETLPSMASHLQKLVPHAKIGIAHGQMAPHEIESVFHAFKDGRLDILVATTIVESGVDFPNANTILIHQADHHGLADLYQLRGRVGRWNRQAYAYFLVKNMRNLPEISRKRLQALAESSGFGGGMKLAMRDLEIRGAGDILGTEQSGHVAAIGFHFYCKLLKRAVKRLQGSKHPLMVECKLEIPYPAYIPDIYMPEPSHRMEIYQRLGDAEDLEEIDALFLEIEDRFGKYPQEVRWLYYATRVRLLASLKKVLLIKLTGNFLLLERDAPGKKIAEKKVVRPPKSPLELEEMVRLYL